MNDGKKSYGLGRLIVVVDKGITTVNNTDMIVNNGDGFVFSHILKGKEGKRYHKKLFDNSGWISSEDGTYKYKLFTKEYKGKNKEGKKKYSPGRFFFIGVRPKPTWPDASKKKSLKKCPAQSRTMPTA